MLKLTKCNNITFNMQHLSGPLEWDLLIWGSIASKQSENLCFKVIATAEDWSHSWGKIKINNHFQASKSL